MYIRPTFIATLPELKRKPGRLEKVGEALKIKMMKHLFILSNLLVGVYFGLSAQYAPAVGETGSSAIYKDDASFVGWAKGCKVKRGYINISDTTKTFTQGQITSNRAFFGSEDLALGIPNGALDCVSLGDGGSAIVSFDYPIKNGEGADFAVFENGLKMQEAPYQYFLELAFVEVSTNGKRFVRFPAVSNTPVSAQIATFGQIDPTQINNFAGKYITNYGTPFDLQELKDSVGINLDSINYIRLIDVVGDIDAKYATYDSKGQIVNDPFPTEFYSGGFDLEAIGVRYFNKLASGITTVKAEAAIYPNPIKQGDPLNISFSGTDHEVNRIVLWTLSGKEVYTWHNVKGQQTSLTMPVVSTGIYFLRVQYANYSETIKLCVVE